MRIGYARVSTEDQTLDLQRDALKLAKCREVYEEQATGKNTGRPQLEACLKSLREGDTLVVWRLDRLGRNLADLVGLIAEFERRKINFESLTEKIETRSPAGRLVFHVFAALAEFERNLIRERTVAGLKAARARGRKGVLLSESRRPQCAWRGKGHHLVWGTQPRRCAAEFIEILMQIGNISGFLLKSSGFLLKSAAATVTISIDLDGL